MSAPTDQQKLTSPVSAGLEAPPAASTPAVPSPRLASPASPSSEDADLIRQVRGGDSAAFGLLYERHAASAHRLARQLTAAPDEQHDLVAEAFTRTLALLRAGKGPDSHFAAYLRTAVRHLAYNKTARDRRVELPDDLAAVADRRHRVPFDDPAVHATECRLAAAAFRALPERWQEVLYRTELLEMTPIEAAPDMGLTANGLSVLKLRARRALRTAYLQAGLVTTGVAAACQPTVSLLAAWTRDALSARDRSIVTGHLTCCAPCQDRAAELQELNSEIGR